MPTLLLVDGSSYLYRAFHALPDLRNRANEPTGALYGVINMLRRLRNDYKTDHIACIFDAKGKTFRDDWYPEYKANRTPMPDDLRLQIEPIHTAVQALGWPLLMVDGVEADDVIGTLAKQAAQAGYEVIVSTGDKDLAQLVTSQVRLVNTMSNEVLDVAGVQNKFGVAPERIVDYLALIGDSVDNIPGVAKVGPKTAVKWLTQYGTLDEIIVKASEISGAVGENLRTHLEFLPLGRRLLTVNCEVPLPVGLEGLLAKDQDVATLGNLFERYEFKTWRKELDKPADAVEASNAPPTVSIAPDIIIESVSPTPKYDAHRANYETILTWPQFDTWLAKINAASISAFDTETTSICAMEAQIVGISFAVNEGEAAYLPLAHNYPGAPTQLPLPEVLDKLKPWFESEAHHKLGQNLKYDMHILANYGITVRGVTDDTLLQSAALESDKGHDLEQLATRHLNLKTISYVELCGKGAKQIGFGDVCIDDASAYGAEDADLTLRIHQHFQPALASNPGINHVYRNIEMPVIEVLLTMERNGVLIDTFLLAQQSTELAKRMHEIETEAHALAKQPFNLNSPKQIQEILFEREKLPVVKKTPTGAPSTDEEVLQQLALDYPLPKLILDYRSMAKLKNTYCDKLPQMVNRHTGRVHTSFSQTGAITGRLSSSDPNLQNIPIRTQEGRRIRAAFIAPKDWHVVSADYSQIELRIMAHLSQDKRLLDAFANGEDIHRATAAEIFSIPLTEVTNEQRRYTKAINFGLIYGMSAHGLAKQLNIERSAAQTYIDRYFMRYPGVAQYMEATRQLAREKAYVETVFGRRLWLPEIRASQAGRRQAAERAAINAPMQGTAADIVKMAMRAVHDWLQKDKMRSRLLLQVHDELVLEVPANELAHVKSKLARIMSDVAELSVPLLVEVGHGNNWDEAH